MTDKVTIEREILDQVFKLLNYFSGLAYKDEAPYSWKCIEAGNVSESLHAALKATK